MDDGDNLRTFNCPTRVIMTARPAAIDLQSLTHTRHVHNLVLHKKYDDNIWEKKGKMEGTVQSCPDAMDCETLSTLWSS